MPTKKELEESVEEIEKENRDMYRQNKVLLEQNKKLNERIEGAFNNVERMEQQHSSRMFYLLRVAFKDEAIMEEAKKDCNCLPKFN